jgi:hypothetical protein
LRRRDRESYDQFLDMLQLAWVLLVAVHDRNDPGVDVYTELYRLAGLNDIPGGERKKPSCCDPDGVAPFMAIEITELAERARMLRRRPR